MGLLILNLHVSEEAFDAIPMGNYACYHLVAVANFAAVVIAKLGTLFLATQAWVAAGLESWLGYWLHFLDLA
jgi:hypothetical protein